MEDQTSIEEFKKQFEEELDKKNADNHMIVKWDRAQRILALLKGGKDTRQFKQTITNAGYQRMVIPSISNEEQEEEEVLFRKDANVIGLFRRVAIYEDFFDIITRFHGTEKHVGMEKTWKAVSGQYTCLPRAAVRLYVELCPDCHRKRAQEITPPLQPILLPIKFNSRCQSQPSATSNNLLSSASPTDETTAIATTLSPPSSATTTAQTTASKSPELSSTSMTHRFSAPEEVLNKKRKTTDDLSQDLTEYQRLKLQKMDIQNQHLRTLCIEVKQLRSELIASNDLQAMHGSI